MSSKVNFKFQSPEESPGYLLAQLSMIWQRRQKQILDPLDLTHTQFVLLASIAWLTKSSDSVMQVDIANQNNFDRMMVSKVLRTLEKKNFIQRLEHGTDTRAKIVNLTKEGEAILKQALPLVEKMDGKFFSVLDSQLSIFNLNMTKLIKENKEG